MKVSVQRRDWLHHSGGSVLGLVLSAGVAGVGLLPATSAQAHDYRAGDLVIDHPYATPTPAGTTHAAFHLRTLRNTGSQPERLLGASSPVAASVEIHQRQPDGQMRILPALDVPAGGEISLKHGGNLHLRLVGLKQPLAKGDRFPLTLRFARAGEQEVRVWVVQPRANGQESGY